jgi:hypothetical protein
MEEMQYENRVHARLCDSLLLFFHYIEEKEKSLFLGCLVVQTYKCAMSLQTAVRSRTSMAGGASH